jgi:hypothetical protein
VGGLIIRPLTFRAACAFVAAHHRHNHPPRGHKFSVGLYEGADLLGVAMAGRPIARHEDDGLTLEVNRTCTLGARNANSMLYGAVRRAAFAMGYDRVITYTQADETGASLRGAGFQRVRELEPRGSWHECRQATRTDLFDVAETGGVARVLWESNCRSPSS